MRESLGLVNIHAFAYIFHMIMTANSSPFRFWVGLVRAQARLSAAVTEALDGAGLPNLDWYDVLLELERAEVPLRACELEKELLLPQYNLSRLLDRIEKAGLIARRAHPDDARSQQIHLTDKGRHTRAEIWNVYRDVIETALADVPESELLAATATLQRAGQAEGTRGASKCIVLPDVICGHDAGEA